MYLIEEEDVETARAFGSASSCSCVTVYFCEASHTEECAVHGDHTCETPEKHLQLEKYYTSMRELAKSKNNNGGKLSLMTVTKPGG